MEKELKSYTSMNTQQKAQAIYNYMEKEQQEALENLLMELSFDYSDDPVMTLDNWVGFYKNGGKLFGLIKTAQESKSIDINDDYIRLGSYYYSAKTSYNVLDLVDEDEAVDWIASALDDGSDLLEDIDKVMQIKFN